MEAGYRGGASLFGRIDANDGCLDMGLASSVDGVKYANCGGLSDGVGRPQFVSENPYSLQIDIALFDISMLYNASEVSSAGMKSC